MFSLYEHRKTIESFKKNQISEYIELVYNKVYAIIQGPHTSQHIAQYFKDEKAPLFNLKQKREQEKAGAKAAEPAKADEQAKAETKEQQEKRKREKRQQDGLEPPFSGFQLEPDNISQIKKLINALYFAHITFQYLEDLSAIDLEHKWQDLMALQGPIVKNAYEASYLATHLDVNLRELFKEELDFILPKLAQVQKLVEAQAKDSTKALKTAPHSLSYKAGEITGIAVDQMRPIGGDVDFNFLTQFSGVLPGYIQQLTQSIQKYSSSTQKNTPKLSKAKLAELQNAALSLLSDIETTQDSGLFASVNLLNYIQIIRNVITLSTSILDQVSDLTDSSQDVIIDLLSQFKYKILPALFGLVDKIEVNLMLRPGTLSKPLMEKIKSLYQALIYLPGKAVDLQEKCPGLLTIEDSRFIELRLELSYKRIDNANKKLFKIYRVEESLTAFYAELSKPEYAKLSLHALPPKVKTELIKYYKLIQPYMARLDVDFNNQVIASLLGGESYSAYFARPIRAIRKQLSPDHVKRVLAKKEPLQELIAKNKNSQAFHTQLNQDIIQSVYDNAELALLPYDAKTPSLYVTDESIPLKIKPDTEKFILKKEEFRKLQGEFAQFVLLIKGAPRGDTFCLDRLSDKEKKDLQELYAKLHPYLKELVPSEQQKDIQDFATRLSSLLSDKDSGDEDMPEVSAVNALMDTSTSYLHATLLAWKTHTHYDLQKREFLSVEKSKAIIEAESKKLKFVKAGENNELEDSKNLSVEQALVLGTWYQNKSNKFETVKIKYNEFVELLKSQTAKDNNLLNLIGLDDKVKEKLRNLYHIFQPYFIASAPQGLKAAYINIDKTLVAALSLRPISPQQAPSIEDFLAIEFNFPEEKAQKAYTTFTTLLKNRKLSGSVLSLAELPDEIKESCRDLFYIFQPYLVAPLKSELKEKALHFNKFFVRALSNRKKELGEVPLIGKLLVLNTNFQDPAAKEAYYQFIKLLKSYRLTGSFLDLANINKDKKLKLQGLYQVFQPHFVAAAPLTSKDLAIDIDKFLFALLSTEQMDPKLTPLIADLTNKNEHLNKDFERVNRQWHQKAQSYNQAALEKFSVETQVTPLQLATNADPRAYHLLKDTKTSKAIREFRTAMFNILTFFNKSMREQLVPQPSDKVPFPEMEYMDKQLDQSQQVRAIKDLCNTLFHLEHIALELEKLKSKQGETPSWLTQANYIWILLVEAYGHLNEIKESALRLSQDPHYSFIALEVMHKAQDLYATFQAHTSSYQVAPIPEITYNPLWYILNAFYISPKHIRALKSSNYLTLDELDRLNQKAQRATLTIQAVINNSGKYFQLFLQTPQMLSLYKEMIKKLNEFTTTTHDAVLANLESTRKTLFTPMLLEADHWESKLGFAPGSFSEPLRRIIDEYFKGLLHPLNLHSQKHIGLVCDSAPLAQRKLAVEKQIADAKQEIQQVEAHYADFGTLVDLMKRYEELKSAGSASDLLEKMHKNLNSTYIKILPKLQKLRLAKQIIIEPSRYPEDHVFDEVCTKGLKQYDPKFTEVQRWVTAAYHYSVGLKATHTITLRGAEEKLAFLTQLKTVQEQENQQFVEQYTAEAFDKHLDAMCNRHVGLQYTDGEYRTKLKTFLLGYRPEIIGNSKRATDINANIQKLLKDKISIFEDKHYAEFYHLDSVWVAIAQFKNYFSRATMAMAKGKSSFENQDTLAQKSSIIDELEDIAKKRDLSVKKRLKQIRIKVSIPGFDQKILKHAQVDTFSFAYLLQCLETLLAALHLYTPSRNKLLNNLNNAVDNPPPMKELTQRFGLFSNNPTSPGKNANGVPEAVPVI